MGWGHDRARAARRAVLCRVGERVVALPVEHVVETMRPLEVHPMETRSRAVVGVAVVRGEPVPVVSAAALLGATETTVGRFVTLAIEGRTAALAVEAVLGVGEIPDGADALPPLLADAEAIAALRVLDRALAAVLDASRIVPAEVWSQLERSS